MRAFLLALVAGLVIMIGANFVLDNAGFSSAEDGTSASNVRLD